MLRSLAVVVGFAALTLFPLWEQATHALPDAPLDEKRLPAPEPSWKTAASLKDYLSGWQTWFNDRYAGRNLLIRLKTQIDYSVFSYADKVYIGRDGWLFYRTVLDEEEPNVEALRPADIDAIIGEFSSLHQWLRDRGITLVIVDNSLKNRYYPEFVPASAPHVAPVNGDSIRRRLKSDTGAIVIDTPRILRRVMASRPIFHRTDFHWNDPAAFEVASATVDAMAADAGMPSAGWHLPLKIDIRPLTGGQASFMPLLRPPVEQALFIHPWQSQPADYVFNSGPYEFIQRLKSPQWPVLPIVAVMGDSFYDGMARSGFAEHFVAVYRARIYHATLQDMLEHLPPGTRFVMVEFIETEVPMFTIPLDFTALDHAFPRPKEKAESPHS